MTSAQWDILVRTIQGNTSREAPVGFIIDSPWLPGWFGVSTLEYYTSDKVWFEANRKAVEKFPDIIFLPGFWSEYGMCTEPSAFGAKMVWNERNLPHAERVIRDWKDVDKLRKPDPHSDGLLPFMIQRLENTLPEIEAIGHSIKFAVTRGPLNIASFLAGTTELMMGMALQPEIIHKFLSLITDFIIDWLRVQIEHFPSIDGILVLDDLVGFLGEQDFRMFGLTYLKAIYNSFPVTVKFFHNDAQGLVCAPYLDEIGINLFNFSHEHSLSEMHHLTGSNITLLGNIPPRDIMAQGSSADVEKAVEEAWRSVTDKFRIIWSCGGGMPMNVPTENIQSFSNAVRHLQ